MLRNKNIQTSLVTSGAEVHATLFNGKKSKAELLYRYLTNSEYGKSYETRYRPPNDVKFIKSLGVETK